jgi:hypothetical protein
MRPGENDWPLRVGRASRRRRRPMVAAGGHGPSPRADANDRARRGAGAGKYTDSGRSTEASGSGRCPDSARLRRSPAEGRICTDESGEVSRARAARASTGGARLGRRRVRWTPVQLVRWSAAFTCDRSSRWRAVAKRFDTSRRHTPVDQRRVSRRGICASFDFCGRLPR